MKCFQALACWLVKIYEREDGQDLVEYSLLLAFIALAVVALLTGVKTNIKGIYSTINSVLASASTTVS